METTAKAERAIGPAAKRTGLTHSQNRPMVTHVSQEQFRS